MIFLKQATARFKESVSDESSGSDFDDDEDPDKIEVPGELFFCISFKKKVEWIFETLFYTSKSLSKKLRTCSFLIIFSYRFRLVKTDFDFF